MFLYTLLKYKINVWDEFKMIWLNLIECYFSRCFVLFYLSCFTKSYFILIYSGFLSWACFSPLSFDLWNLNLFYCNHIYFILSFHYGTPLLLEILWLLFVVAIIFLHNVFQFSFFKLIDDLPLKFYSGISQSSYACFIF